MLDDTICHIEEGCVQIQRTDEFNFTNNSLTLLHFHKDSNQIVYKISLT
jgi:hypothetical protein